MNPLYIIAVAVISLLYIWTLYNVPVLFAGIKRLRSNKSKNSDVCLTADLPSVSVIVPVKNEENVVARLLTALINADYPKEKKQIIVVEDGSMDRTAEICKKFADNYPTQVQVICRNVSDGKPSALMAALKRVKGDIVGVFDADNVPESDSLSRAANYFNDSSVVAVQGRICSINSDENMLTKIVANEENIRYEGFMGGKEELGLFVPINGSCYFVRKTVLNQVGGWDTNMLSEDMELAARLIHNGHKIKYASDVKSWQEYPSSFMGYFKQRIRWFRGTMEVGVKYGKLLRHLNKLSIDTEITLAGSFVFISCIVGYIVAILSLANPISSDFFSSFIANFTTVLTIVLLGLAGTLMVYTTKPRKIKNILWVPFLYGYWILQNFIATYALLQIIFRAPRKWERTPKTGVTTNTVPSSKL